MQPNNPAQGLVDSDDNTSENTQNSGLVSENDDSGQDLTNQHDVSMEVQPGNDNHVPIHHAQLESMEESLDETDQENQTPGPKQGDVEMQPSPRKPLSPPTIELLLSELTPDSEYQELASGVSDWLIPSWSQMEASPPASATETTAKIYGPTFSIGDYKWRLMLFPKGNRPGATEVSCFLESVDCTTDKKDDPKFSVCAEFAIVVKNPAHPHVYRYSSAHHRFTPSSTDWGFTSLVSLESLHSTPDTFEDHPHERPYTENDQVIFGAYVRIAKDEVGTLWRTDFDGWDSKTETGYVGLKNQGATCYMNSLLQSLFFTNYFRKAVYQIPTDNDEPAKSIPLALQRVFYNLQFSSKAVDTRELTTSFGWDTMDAFHQHDVQEFSRVLQDTLEMKMKGTAAENTVSKLFVGKMKSYIKCINVDYESSRFEDYYDIQLNVKKIPDLYSSFRDFTQVETMDGDNKYQAEGHGLQDAKKGLVFKTFPPVLHLQLKRFDYDFQRDAMVKINDRFEYPLEIDLAEFLETPEDKAAQSTKYHLHAVLVHCGDSHGGHYWTYIKPTATSKWYRFDDDRVIPARLREVLDDSYGTDVSGKNMKIPIRTRFTNAYMLVYIRDTDRPWVLQDISENDVPKHIEERLRKEEEEREMKRREREELQNSIRVHILTENDIKQHVGFDLCHYEDRQLPATPMWNERVRKDMTWNDFLENVVSKRFSMSKKRFRLWLMTGRQNKTIRPDCPLVGEAVGDETLEAVAKKQGSKALDLRLYMETAPDDVTDDQIDSGSDVEISDVSEQKPKKLKTWRFPDKSEGNTDTNVLMFIKYFDAATQTVRYAGHVYIPNKNVIINDMIPEFNRVAGFSEDEKVLVYEEIRPTMNDIVKRSFTIRAAELGDGDILTLLRANDVKALQEDPQVTIRTPADYFDALWHRVTCVFRDWTRREEVPTTDMEVDDKKTDQDEAQHERPKELTIVTSRKKLVSELLEQLAIQLNCPQENILIYQMIQGKWNHVKHIPSLTVTELFSPIASSISTYNLSYGNASAYRCEFYYEILDMSVERWQSRRFLTIPYIDSHGKTTTVRLDIPKMADVRELINEFLEKVPHEEGFSGQVQLFELTNSRLVRGIPPEEQVGHLAEHTMAFYEFIPEYQLLYAENGDRLMQVVHFHKDPIRRWGFPLLFGFRAGEDWRTIKTRVRSRMNVSEKEFSKWKVVLVDLDAEFSEHASRAFEDDDIIDASQLPVHAAIGIDHPNPARTATRGADKGIKITG